MSHEANEAEPQGWYVVRTRPKSEHIAALHLVQYAHIDPADVFSPRIKFEKSTKRGKVWFTEALFPGYIFVRFPLFEKLRTVNATNAVTGVLRFADDYPQLPDEIVEELRSEFSQEEKEVRVIAPEVEEGDEVVVLDGAMAGLKSIVTRVFPSQERVRILMEILGEEREVTVDVQSISKPGNIRAGVKIGETASST